MTGTELKAIRDRLGLTQAELAAWLYYTVRAVQSWEQGWRGITPRVERMIRKLEEAKQ